jgi:hypothetical protein
MTTPANPTMPPQTTHRPPGRAIGIVLSVGVAAVFVVLWVGAAIALFTDGEILADAWAWLTSLPPVAAVVVWILILPVAVGLWAWSADLAPIAMGAVVIGLVAWTFVAASGLVKAFSRR